MFQALLAASLVFAAADPIPNPADKPSPPAAVAPAPKAARQACKEVPVIGTRFTKTVCSTRAEIDTTASRDKLNLLQPNPVR